MAKTNTTTRSRASSASTSTGAGGGNVGGVMRKKSMTRKAKATTIAAKREARIEALRPRKPPTAFFYFLEDFRRGFQDQNPEIKSMREVGKACGEKWKTMTYEEKVQYYDIATEKRAEFEISMADFIKRKENEEFDDEFDDDSEFDG